MATSPTETEYLIVISEVDPVAVRVAEQWGPLESIGEHIDGAAVRRLGPRTLVLGRAAHHIHDDDLDARLPSVVRDRRPTIVFPSIHRSAQNIPCITAHPVGNPGPSADFGGRPRTLCPSDPRSMTSVLRSLAESSSRSGLSATYESTHHGPALGLPTFFVEIGYGADPEPPSGAVAAIADALREIRPDPADRVALAVGGGHYAPHFSELALARRWAFGHILSRHALDSLDRATAAEAYRGTPGSEGILFARAQDAGLAVFESLGPRLREAEAPLFEAARGASTRGAGPSGT